MADEVSTTNSPNDQNSTETPVITPSDESNTSTEQIPAEVAANPDFISWKYPPYCELCHVYFNNEFSSKTHFDNASHKNRLQTWKKHQDSAPSSTNSKNVLCDTCWKEMNTQKIFDTHCQSPAHLKAEKGRLIVQKLKDDYTQLKESQNKS